MLVGVVLNINLVSVMLFRDFDRGRHINGMLNQFLLFFLSKWNSPYFLYSLLIFI